MEGSYNSNSPCQMPVDTPAEHRLGCLLLGRGSRKPQSLAGCGQRSRPQSPWKPGPWKDQQAGPSGLHTL